MTADNALLLRTFLAVELPRALQQQIHTVQHSIRTYLAQQQLVDSFSWTAPEKLHVTLRFLGDTNAAQRTQISSALPAVALRHHPFQLHLQGVGCFPNFRAPNVIWLGLGGDLTALANLQKAIEQLARTVGFSAETRAFSPHLTIARAQRRATSGTLGQAGRAMQQFAQAATLPANTTFPVTQVVYLRSELLPGGAQYTPLQYFPLAQQP